MTRRDVQSLNTPGVSWRPEVAPACCWLFARLHPVRTLPASHSRCSKPRALSQNEGDRTERGGHKSPLPASSAGCAALGDRRVAVVTVTRAAVSSLGTP